MKFVLLHEAKNDEGIRAFFMDVWELYVKVCTFSVSITPYLGGVPACLQDQCARRVPPSTAEIRQFAFASRLRWQN